MGFKRATVPVATPPAWPAGDLLQGLARPGPPDPGRVLGLDREEREGGLALPGAIRSEEDPLRSLGRAKESAQRRSGPERSVNGGEVRLPHRARRSGNRPGQRPSRPDAIAVLGEQRLGPCGEAPLRLEVLDGAEETAARRGGGSAGEPPRARRATSRARPGSATTIAAKRASHAGASLAKIPW